MNAWAGLSGAVAVSTLEHLSPEQVWRRVRGTWNCRCEHEPQIRFPARSSPAGRCWPDDRRSRGTGVHDRVAGLDVHRDVVAACVRVPGFGANGDRGGAVSDHYLCVSQALGVVGRTPSHAGGHGGHLPQITPQRPTPSSTSRSTTLTRPSTS